MLKKQVFSDTIYCVRWDCMNNNVLISSAMLNAYWEKEKKDTLDLLVPFVKYAIAKTTEVGKNIEVEKIASCLNTDFGYETIPINVITLILNRLTTNVLKKEHGEYFLTKNLDEEMEKFDKRILVFKEYREKVSLALVNYLNLKLVTKKYDADLAIKALIGFFSVNGLTVINEPARLNILKSKDDKEIYYIAQFILEEQEKNTSVFSYIVEMVKGFFVSTVISLQPQNPSITASKFKGLKCFIDTRVILSALGLHSESEEKAAIELLKMLREKGADLYCFEHTYQEIKDIILAYKNCLSKPSNPYQIHTLQRWDEYHYTVADVDNYLSLLKSKITKLGFVIQSAPEITDTAKYPFNDAYLAAYIRESIPYYGNGALDNDIRSVASIFLLRNGKVSTEIEKCEYIFVTPNLSLCSLVNSFLVKNEICNVNDEVMPIISDIDISSILWLKCYSTHQDYPKQKLIEHALAALEPTSLLIKTFNEKIDRIEAAGGITEDEAAILRADLFAKRMLMSRTQGDIKEVEEATIYEIRDELKTRYVSETKKEAELNYEYYIKEREKNRQSIENAIAEITATGKKVYEKCYTKLIRVAWTLIVIIWLAFCWISASDACSEGSFSVSSLVILVVGLYSTLDMFIAKMNYIKKLIRITSDKKSTLEKDKKREEYERILNLSLIAEMK